MVFVTRHLTYEGMPTTQMIQWYQIYIEKYWVNENDILRKETLYNVDIK